MTLVVSKHLKFSEKITLETSDLVMIYRARGKDERDFFAYVFCDKDGVIAMKKDYAENQPGAPEQYGEVIYSDYITDPDEKARAFLKNWLDKKGGKSI